MGKRYHARHRSIEGELLAERNFKSGEIIGAFVALDLIRADCGSARDNLRSKADIAIRENNGMPFSQGMMEEFGHLIVGSEISLGADEK